VEKAYKVAFHWLAARYIEHGSVDPETTEKTASWLAGVSFWQEDRTKEINHRVDVDVE